MLKMDETTKFYEFRALDATDIFPMLSIINKIGFSQFKDCFQSEAVQKAITNDGEATVESLGIGIAFDLAGIVIGNLPSCEDDIYSMLARVSNLEKKEIKKLPMAVFIEMIADFIQRDEFRDFLKVVSRFFK